jgi:translation initiation factor IF-3
MRSSRCLFNTTVALYRVFVAPIEQSNLRVTRLISSSAISRSFAPSLFLSQQTRCYAVLARPPRDEEIKSWSVVLVDEDNKLSEPRQTFDILQNINRKVESLVVVAQGEPGAFPICKIMNKQAMREAEKAKAKAARGSGITTKTMELNWAIDKGDLGHRMDKLKQFLGKGFRVEVLLIPKRKGKQATEEEARAVLKKVKDAMAEVEGSKEMKPMEGQLLRTATMYLEGKAVQKDGKAPKPT